MIKAGIIGSTGYAGAELVRLLLNHPEAEIVWYGSRSYVGDPYADVYGNFFLFFDESCLICGSKQDRTHQYFRETRIIPDSNDPEYEKALAEEVSVIRDLMQEQIEADRRESLIQLI